jgi:hypothetical protein
MKKTIWTGLLAVAFAAVTFATIAQPQAQAAPPCQRKTFKTKQIAAACKSGGQKAAKDAMKAFVKDVKKHKKADGDASYTLTCDRCHKALKGDYPLKADGLKEFEALSKYLASKQK